MKETVLNKYDVPIVKCCASCANKEFLNEASRHCKHHNKKTKPGYKCDSWIMNSAYMNMGLGGGGIKKKAYLQYVMSNLTKGRIGIDRARYEFEKEHGSIYLIKP